MNGVLWGLVHLFTVHAADFVPAGTTEKVLDNGLRVVVVPMSSPLVSVQIWMDVGSRHEVAPNTTGYAHFFEHLMFRGSAGFSAAEREQTMLSLSAVDNAWTSSDHTCYHTLAPAEHVLTVLDLEADRLQSLQLTPQGVEQEAGAVMGEYRKDIDQPQSRMWTRLQALAYATHPYGHTTIGMAEDVMAMAGGFETAQRFYVDHYRPEHTTVVVAGGVVVEAVLDAVEARFVEWESPPNQTRERVPMELPQQEERREHITWSGGQTSPRMLVAWKGPIADPSSKGYAALRLVSMLLTDDAAPFSRGMIQDDQLAWSVWSAPPRNVDPGLFVVSMHLRDGVSFDDAEDKLHHALLQIQEISAEELEQVQQRARRALLLSLVGPQQWASAVGRYAARGWGVSAMEIELERMMSVQPEDIRTVVERVFVDAHKNVVTLSMGDAP